MKDPFEKIQAGMMTEHGSGMTRREKKRIEYLTKARHEQRRVVMEALPRRHLLQAQMAECGTRDDSNNLIYCRVPLCPRCHMRERTVQSAIAIKREFVGATNDEMAFVTILLPVQMDFSGMTKLFETEKRRLRTLIDRRRAKDPRWNDFQLMGWWEIDRMTFGDYAGSGRNTRLALDDLDFPVAASPETTIWRPHLHAIVRLGRLTAEEVTGALRKETHTGAYQVDLQRFHTNRDVADNLKNVIRYSLKFRIECDYKRPDALDFIDAENAEDMTQPRAWWPTEDIAAYADWLCPAGRSGFQSLRVMIGSKTDEEDNGATATAQVGNDKNGSTFLSAIIDRVRHQNRKDKASKAHGIACLPIVADLKAIEMKRKELVLIRDHRDRGVCVYNNTIHDANWTGDAPSLMPSDGTCDGPPIPSSEKGLITHERHAEQRR